MDVCLLGVLCVFR